MSGIVGGVCPGHLSGDDRDRVSSSSGGVRDLTFLPPGKSAWFTILIRFDDDVVRLAPLLCRIAMGLGSAVAEVLISSSREEVTEPAVLAAAKTAGMAVRLLRLDPGRRPQQPMSAPDSLRAARGSWAVVMDRDCALTTDLLLAMISTGRQHHLDVVTAGALPPATDVSGGDRATHSGPGSTGQGLTVSIRPARGSDLAEFPRGGFAVRLTALMGSDRSFGAGTPATGADRRRELRIGDLTLAAEIGA